MLGVSSEWKGREGTGLVIARLSGFFLSNNEPQCGQRAAAIRLEKRGRERRIGKREERERERGGEEGRKGRGYLICETTE